MIYELDQCRPVLQSYLVQCKSAALLCQCLLVSACFWEAVINEAACQQGQDRPCKRIPVMFYTLKQHHIAEVQVDSNYSVDQDLTRACQLSGNPGMLLFVTVE